MLVPPHMAPEDALEWYFDHYIADQPVLVKEENSRAEKQEGPSNSEKEERGGEEEKEEPEKNTKDTEPEVSSFEIPQPQILNVMCSASLSCRLNLRWIAQRVRNAEYKRNHQFLTMRIRSPKATAMLRSDGFLQCTGVSSLEEAHKVARRVARIVQRMGFPVVFCNYTVHNCVAIYRTFPVSLEHLYRELPGRRSYKPELFGSLVFYCEKVTASVFHTGAVVFTGSGHRSEYTAAFSRMYPALCAARRRPLGSK